MGLVYLYTGNGAGKTTNALGLALRAVGHGQKAVIIQFLKGRKDIGEYKVRKRLGLLYEIHLFGSREFVNPKKLKPIDYEMARKGLDFARKALKSNPRLLVLDEVNLALAGGLLKVDEVLDLLSVIPKETSVVLTGRYAPQALIDRADIVNEVREIKSPKELVTEKGIQY